jgi:DNA ligase D-like protein (predicted 3'-phosphoesterase)
MAHDDAFGNDRDPTVSEERADRVPAACIRGRQPRFVVQRHDAATLHYDFRLEVDGILKSWAVPNGPSPNPSDQRLATRTEDHPLLYAEFEGVIGRGGWGAGTMVVWDTGSYRNLTSRHGEIVDMAEALRTGHASFWLEGSKLCGAYALTRTWLNGGEQWLLVKVNDEKADRFANPTTTRPESVLTGRTNADLEPD